MELLEDVLKKVEDLSRDLSVEILVEPAKAGHFEYIEGSWAGNPAPEFNRKEWVPEVPAIMAPDKEKQEVAKTQLQQIYDSSGWYCARYIAGRALGISPQQKMPNWINELREQLYSGEIKMETEDTGLRTSGSACARIDDDSVWKSVATITPDKMHMKAVKDAIALLRFSSSKSVRNLLKSAYGGGCSKEDREYLEMRVFSRYPLNPNCCSLNTSIIFSEDPAVRREIGTALGYLNLRIWIEEHPVAAILTGIAAGSALAYMICNHLSK